MVAAETAAKPGRYEIRSKPGEGGMGKGYRSQDTKLDREVGLKLVMTPERWRQLKQVSARLC
jgi:hypothetical protein